MPVEECSENGKPGWRWGSGKCYTYPTGNKDASGKAKQKAYLQGAAATKGTMKEEGFQIIRAAFLQAYQRQLVNQTTKQGDGE